MFFALMHWKARVCLLHRFLVSVCYSKAKVAAACAGIVYFLSYVPYMYVAIREEAAGDKISAVVKSLVVSNTLHRWLWWILLETWMDE